MRNFILNFFIVFLLCSAATLLALSRLDYPLTGIDDANIYFVYARNLADGHGFVYNIGGERVEGFTSLLWTLISALAIRLSTYPEVVLLIINIGLMSLGIACVLNRLQSAFPSKNTSRHSKLLWSAIFLLLLITSPRYIVWNTATLMENSLWSTLLLITTIFVIGEHSSARVINSGFVPLSILLLLTRPESFVWVAVFAVVLFMRVAVTSNSVDALKALAPSAACIAITLVLLTSFRLQYFGYPLPNTYYAKVSPSLTYNLQQGTIYLTRYFVSEPIVLVSIIAIFVASLQTIRGIFSRQIPSDGSFFLPVIASTGLLMPLLTGGDHFGSFRVYQNIYPIVLLCLLYAIKRRLSREVDLAEYLVAAKWKRIVFSFGMLPLVFLGFLLNQAYLWMQIGSEIAVEFRVSDYGRKNGTFIQELFSSLSRLPSISVVTSGGIKYSYSGEVVDLMGLNNTLMAHNHGERIGIKNHAAFDIPTFYQLQPDIVWPRAVQESKWQYIESEVKGSWENKEGLKGLFNEPHFLELYTYAKVSSQIKSKNGYALVAWFKKDFLRDLAADPNFLIEEYINIP